MAQDEDFGFQPLLRLEAVAQHAEKQQADAIIRRSCSVRRCPRVKWMEFSEATAATSPFSKAQSRKRAAG
jgi:hypothetical protein